MLRSFDMNGSVTKRRHLRSELRKLRVDAGLTQKDVAESLDWSTSKIIRIESGVVAIRVTDLQALLQHYGVTEADRVEQLVEMARNSKNQPFSGYKDVHSVETIRYFAYESSATRIRQFEPLLIPGTLQTEEYTRALLQSYDISDDRIDRIQESRRERQEFFEADNAPEAFFILDEAAIRRTVGGRGVMQRQLDRLVEAAERPHVRIQVIPFVFGAHKGLQGPFVYLEFDEDDADVLYLENPLGDAVFREDPEITSKYLETFFKLEGKALPAAELANIIRSQP